VDTFLDMGRSATNAVGNSVAASVVAKWEGGLMSEKDADANAKRLDREMDRSLHPDAAPSAA
jgi:Na+/H+-dicarboxylate symporter